MKSKLLKKSIKVSFLTLNFL